MTIDTKTIAELPASPEEPPLEIVAITADMPTYDRQKLRSRAAIGRDAIGDMVAKVVSDCIVDRDAIEAVQAKLLEKLPTLRDVKDVALVAEAMKNLINTGVASSGLLLQCAETMALGSKRKNKQSNAPQMIFTGDNPQVIAAPLPVGGQ